MDLAFARRDFCLVEVQLDFADPGPDFTAFDGPGAVAFVLAQDVEFNRGTVLDHARTSQHPDSDDDQPGGEAEIAKIDAGEVADQRQQPKKDQ